MKLSGAQYFSILAVFLVLVFLPILSVDQPPLADYPNYLARVHVWLMHGSSDAVPFVEPVWALQPNMVFELVTSLLSLFMPLEQAGRGFVLLTVVSLVVGPAILGRSLWGTFSVWSFLPLLLVYNRLFFWGFLGYLFSLGVALGLSSLWVRQVRNEKRIMWFFTASLASFVVLGFHLYAFAFLALVATILTMRSVVNLPALGKKWFFEIFFRLAPLAVPLPLFAFWAPVFDSEHSIKWGPFLGKITSFGGLFVGPNAQVDLILGGLVVVCLAIGVYKKALMPFADKWLFGGLLILMLLHLAMPTQILSSYGADQRLPIAIALLGAAVTPPPRFRELRLSVVLMIFLLMVLTFRMFFVRFDWSIYQRIHNELMQVYQQLPRRSNVLTLVGTTNPHGLPRIPLTEHSGFAVVARSVFWPGLFAYPIHGAQTISFMNPASIPSSIASAQKIPLSILNDVIAGRQIYQNFDLRDISPCYQFIIVTREDGLAEELPNDAVFGTIRYRGENVAIYARQQVGVCPW